MRVYILIDKTGLDQYDKVMQELIKPEYFIDSEDLIPSFQEKAMELELEGSTIMEEYFEAEKTNSGKSITFRFDVTDFNNMILKICYNSYEEH